MLRFQNDHHVTAEPPAYYSGNRLYPNAHARNDYPTRTSRRVHDGLSIDRNYGLDTTSDDVNSSPYSSPYYVNGRYNSSNLTTQRGNSASVQGTKRLLSKYDVYDDFTNDDIQSTIEMWQGKQIRFKLPYSGKIIGNTLSLKNTDGCTGILSIYLSASENGPVLYETAIDLCNISMDKFEKVSVFSNTTIPITANPRGVIYVRMEIWDEISQERSANPFNTGKKIEISATGLDNHSAAVVELGDKNVPVAETYNYSRKPNRPCMGLIYNNYGVVPTNRSEAAVGGATVSLNGYRYDIYCVKDSTHAEVLIYDVEMNKWVDDTDIRIDGQVENLNLVQAADYVYYVDGYSALQKFKIGEWVSQEVTSDNPPVVAPSLITFHNNRIYISGFRYDPNLFQYTEITDVGPDYDSFIYRQYAPDESPLATSTNPITAIVEYQSDTLMIAGKTFFSLYRTNASGGTVETGYATQVSTFTDGGGVQSAGDICNYHGVLYSFDQDEGIRRFSGAVWNKIPAAIDSHIERVDMTKPRKMWGYANKLYFNYTDKLDGKYKMVIWDMDMNYQQYPWFQDVDVPYADIRYDDDYDIRGIHSDYPCVMQILAQDTWRRFDTPITFERWSKYLSLGGNASDLILKNVHIKTIANANRWWNIGISVDKHQLTQQRNKTITYRMPEWDTLDTDITPEDIFTEQDIYTEKAISLLSIGHIKIQAISAQIKVKCKTFRQQCNLVSILLEVAPRQYN